MDGILYKGRMTNQDMAWPVTSVEKELASEWRRAFLGIPAPDLLGSMRRYGQGSDWFIGPHTAACKVGSSRMPGAAPGTRGWGTAGSRNHVLSPWDPHTSRSRLSKRSAQEGPWRRTAMESRAAGRALALARPVGKGTAEGRLSRGLPKGGRWA